MARGLRRVLRLARVALHLALGLLLVELLYPFLRRDARVAIRASWCHRMLSLLGVRLRVSGPVPLGRHLIASNHVSWLDVFAIGALFPCWFVSKAETRAWPVIGWLAAANETLFLRRRSARAAYRMNIEIRARLGAGHSVAIFPEGTTTDGSRVLPFYPALFQPAVDGGHRVLPMAVCYRDPAGNRVAAAAYIDDEPLWKSLRAVLDSPGIEAHLLLHDALTAPGSRRELAARACNAVAYLHRRQVPEAFGAESVERASPVLNSA
ncbi:MAG TPA: lysophospholipid acyltransferase family protein [Burkholderiales bacterium]|nr:lysophospholipid acyltransferase family protein [Burkholderiales bacterium]